MSKDVNHIIASYDIHDPKRLTKVAKIMKDYGERVLKSVFECNLTNESFDSLKGRVENVIDDMEDSVRYYFLCDKCLRNIQMAGLGESFKENESFIIT